MNTTAPAPDARQMELEQESLEAGQQRFHSHNLRMEQIGLVSTTGYGKRLIAGKLEALANGIRQFISNALTKPGPRASAAPLMQKLEPETLAFMVLQQVLDALPRDQHTLQYIALAIGGAAEDEGKFRAYEQQQEQHFNRTNLYFDKSPWSYSTARRREVLLDASNKQQVVWEPWQRSEKLHLGTALIGLLIKHTGLVAQSHPTMRYRGGRRDTVVSLTPTPDLMDWITQYKESHEFLRPVYMPTLVPPRAWSHPQDGGYHDPRLQYPLVKKVSRGYLKELAGKQMPEVYRAVNALQDTAWKINPAMLTVLHEIWEAGLAVKGLPSQFDSPLPPKPVDFDSNPEARTVWKRSASEVFRSNTRATSKRIQVAKIRYVADKFAAEQKIYFPMQLDFRGRMYAVPLFLNPQGCDLAKSLLTFAEGKPLGAGGAHWLKVHLANTFGYDKVSLAERAQWAEVNAARIESTANDPIGDRWWMEADKPFQFLAAAIEYLGYLHDGGESYVCSLPIMVDGSCNGLQHFSAILRDEVCGAQVNLVPADKPADVYQAVAEAVVAFIQADARPEFAELRGQWLAYGIDRKLCKRPVMILPYGGTRDAVRTYLLDEVMERKQDKGIKHPFGTKLMHAMSYLSSIVWDQMKLVVKGPRVAMDWLQDSARVLTKQKLRIYWTAPSGFWVQQAYLSTEPRRVKTKIGQQIVYLTLREELKNKLNTRKQTQAISPNFVHSLDASALVHTICRTQEQGITSFSAIHDSYGTLAADMQLLVCTLRESFVQMYETRDVLAEFAAESNGYLAAFGKQVPPLPPRGSLDLSGVLKSDFFFA